MVSLWDIMPRIDININMKGRVWHKDNGRTNVKVDYAYFLLEMNKLKFHEQKDLLTELIDDSMITDLPIFSTVLNLRKCQLNLKFDSFRKVRNFLVKALNPSHKHEVKPNQY